MTQTSLKNWLFALHRSVKPQLRNQGPPVKFSSDTQLEDTDPELAGWHIAVVGLPNATGEVLLFLDKSLGDRHHLWYGVWTSTREEIKRIEKLASRVFPKAETSARYSPLDSPRYNNPWLEHRSKDEHYYGWYEAEESDFAAPPRTLLSHRVVDRLSKLLGILSARQQLVPEARVPSSVNSRRGQPKFRRQLLASFNNTCCISGCRVTSLLEAAHISTQKGVDDHRPSNGLLLRADFHTLFDLGLIGLHPKTHTVSVHRSLLQSEYAEFDNKPLLAPQDIRASLSAEDLAVRWARFKKGIRRTPSS